MPGHCDVGVKKNSKGYKQAWIGYKLHVDVNDCGLPISAVLTAVSLHESQVAVPLIKMTSERIDYLYDLAPNPNLISGIIHGAGHFSF